MNALERCALAGMLTLLPVIVAAHLLGDPLMVAVVIGYALVLAAAGITALVLDRAGAHAPGPPAPEVPSSVEDVATVGLTEWAAARVRGGV